MLLALALLAIAQAPAAGDAAAPSAAVALALQPAVGMTDAEVQDAQKKLEGELAGLGVTVVGAVAVDPACVTDPACVDGARGENKALLVVELVRVGPVIQLTATGAAGPAAQATGSHGLDEGQLKKGPLLPDNVRAWVKALAPEKEAPPPPPPPPPEKKGFTLTPVKTGALFAGGVGAVALIAGVILIGTSEPVLEDKTTSGAQKEQAATLGYVGVVATALGVAGLAAGGVLFFALE